MINLLRNFCIVNEYFTGGSNSQYNKLFELASKSASIHELAIVIFLCSENAPLEVIEQNLTNALKLSEVA